MACSARRPVPSWVCSTHHLPCGHITRCVFMSYQLSPHASVVVALLPLLFSRLPTWEASIDSLLLAHWQWKHRRTLFPLRLSITVGCLSSGWAHQCWRLPGSPGNGYGPSGISACASSSGICWLLPVLGGIISIICGTLCLTSRSSRWSMTLGFLSRRGLWMERGVTITPRQAMPLGISGTFIVSLSSKVFVC